MAVDESKDLHNDSRNRLFTVFRIVFNFVLLVFEVWAESFLEEKEANCTVKAEVIGQQYWISKPRLIWRAVHLKNMAYWYGFEVYCFFYCH